MHCSQVLWQRQLVTLILDIVEQTGVDNRVPNVELEERTDAKGETSINSFASLFLTLVSFLQIFFLYCPSSETNSESVSEGSLEFAKYLNLI